MFRYPILASALIAIAAISPPRPSIAARQATPTRLPPGFTMLRSSEASEAQRAAMSQKLGAKITKLSNSVLSIRGHPLQMNLINCSTPDEAAEIYETILAMKQHPAFCLNIGSSVVEFVSHDPALAIMAAFELGFKNKPEQTTYRISFQAAPVEKADYTSWDKLSNLFLAAYNDPNNLALKQRVDLTSEKFKFGDAITLRTAGTQQTRPSYLLDPNAAKKTILSDGELTKYTFKSLPSKLDIPCVSLTATIQTTGRAQVPTTRKPGPELLGPTELWPCDDPQIIALAKKITADCNTPQEKTEAILKWLRPGTNISFPRSVSASRYGVKKTLSQKFGQSWDFSDCFVTLARASQIPSRQVAGWFYALSGHIWAEVLYEDQGWQQVDPTGGGLVKCGIYHIPYITSEDGTMSVLYLSKPKIELLDN